MTHIIIDQVIGRDDAFIAAEYDVAGRNERKVAPQPTELGFKRAGNVHRRGRDEYFISLHQGFDYFRAVRHDRNLSKEVALLKILTCAWLVCLFDHFKNVLAVKVRGR